MMKMLTWWLLLGAFGASAALNVRQARQEAGAEQACVMVKGLSPEGQSAPCGLVETLELTSAQQKRFASCCPKYVRTRRVLHGRVDRLVAELERALNDEKLDKKRVISLAEEISAARAEELKSCIRGIMDVRETLTPGQLARLASTCGQE